MSRPKVGRRRAGWSPSKHGMLRPAGTQQAQAECRFKDPLRDRTSWDPFPFPLFKGASDASVVLEGYVRRKQGHGARPISSNSGAAERSQHTTLGRIGSPTSSIRESRACHRPNLVVGRMETRGRPKSGPRTGANRKITKPCRKNRSPRGKRIIKTPDKNLIVAFVSWQSGLGLEPRRSSSPG